MAEVLPDFFIEKMYSLVAFLVIYNLRTTAMTINGKNVASTFTALGGGQYRVTYTVVEGDTEKLKLRLDNNAQFMGKNLTAKEIEINAESYSNATIHGVNTIKIAAAGKSELVLYGEAKIEIEKFTDSALIQKIYMRLK